MSVAGLAYIWNNISTDLEGSAFAFAMTFGVMSVTYMMIVLLCSRDKLTEIFMQLKKIYDSSKEQQKFVEFMVKSIKWFD